MPISSPFRLAATALLALAAGAAGAKILRAHHAVTHVTTRKFGEWHLAVYKDSFVGTASCRLTARHLSYDRGVLVVHLPEDVDTMNAVYRLDDGAPILASADDTKLIHMGFAIRSDNLFNPSGGLVRIPLDRVGSAGQVRVEAPAGKLWHYPLARLPDAVAALQGAGCS